MESIVLISKSRYFDTIPHVICTVECFIKRRFIIIVVDFFAVNIITSSG